MPESELRPNPQITLSRASRTRPLRRTSRPYSGKDAGKIDRRLAAASAIAVAAAAAGTAVLVERAGRDADVGKIEKSLLEADSNKVKPSLNFKGRETPEQAKAEAQRPEQTLEQVPQKETDAGGFGGEESDNATDIEAQRHLLDEFKDILEPYFKRRIYFWAGKKEKEGVRSINDVEAMGFLVENGAGLLIREAVKFVKRPRTYDDLPIFSPLLDIIKRGPSEYEILSSEGFMDETGARQPFFMISGNKDSVKNSLPRVLDWQSKFRSLNTLGLSESEIRRIGDELLDKKIFPELVDHQAGQNVRARIERRLESAQHDNTQERR